MKKTAMPPPTKRRKTEPTVVEEITFDPSARQEYLTGFHKRKLERAKHAREIAEKQARLEKLEARKQLRDERKAELERHVAEVNAMLDPPEEVVSGSDDDGDTAEEWNGVEDAPPIDHEAEYIDEEKYTTVTVEAMDLSKDGLHKLEREGGKQEDDVQPEIDKKDTQVDPGDAAKSKKRTWTKEKPKDRTDKPKKKRKKFRYETKSERKFTRMKQGARNSREAKARREK